MDLFKVICLSLLEGLTEFIPVSSTGHLILLGAYFGETSDVEKLFDVFIQLGAICAVIILYFSKLLSLIKDLKSADLCSQSRTYGVLHIVIASLPPLLFGFLFYKHIKSVLFYPKPVAVALIVGGLALVLVEKLLPAAKDESRISLTQAFIIGLVQSLSLWPGMSRSGSCLIGARLVRAGRVLSAEFSFIVAIPIMMAAVSYDVIKNIDLFFSENLSMFFVGFIIALISGMLAVKLFISYLAKYSLVPFGVYRIILGLIVLYVSN